MSLRFSLMLFPAVVLSASAAVADIQLGVQKTFRDWSVACDNTLSCEAIVLQPEGGGEHALLLSVSRDAASGSVEINMTGADAAGSAYRIKIDGREVSSGTSRRQGFPSLVLNGAEALKVTRAMAKGKAITLDDGNETFLGGASLAGSAATLRYVDTMQNRVGTSSALQAPGRKLLKPKSNIMPTVTVKRVKPIEKTPDASALVGLVEGSPCAELRQNVTEDSAYNLGEVDGKAKALVLISCGNGAYNIAYAPYIASEDSKDKWTFVQANFDYHDGVRTEDNSLRLLINADWDSSTQKLSNYSKGRGLGDCGNGATYVWDGAIFRLVSAEGMSECRGSLEWLTLWNAAVNIVD
jgi:hypothetical protein